MRQGDLNALRPQILNDRYGLVHGRRHFRIQTVGDKIFFGNPDFQTLQPICQRCLIIRHIHRHGSGVGRIMAGNRIQQYGAVANIFGQGPDLIQRRGKGNQAEARDPAVSGLHSNNPAM